MNAFQRVDSGFRPAKVADFKVPADPRDDGEPLLAA